MEPYSLRAALDRMDAESQRVIDAYTRGRRDGLIEAADFVDKNLNTGAECPIGRMLRDMADKEAK